MAFVHARRGIEPVLQYAVAARCAEHIHGGIAPAAAEVGLLSLYAGPGKRSGARTRWTGNTKSSSGCTTSGGSASSTAAPHVELVHAHGEITAAGDLAAKTAAGAPPEERRIPSEDADRDAGWSERGPAAGVGIPGPGPGQTNGKHDGRARPEIDRPDRADNDHHGT